MNSLPSAAMMRPTDLKVWADAMREAGVEYFWTPEFSLRVGSRKPESVVAEGVPTKGVFESETGSRCACGHEWVTEHSEAGCLLGCSHDLCSSSAGAPDVG